MKFITIPEIASVTSRVPDSITEVRMIKIGSVNIRLICDTLIPKNEIRLMDKHKGLIHIITLD